MAKLAKGDEIGKSEACAAVGNGDDVVSFPKGSAGIETEASEFGTDEASLSCRPVIFAAFEHTAVETAVDAYAVVAVSECDADDVGVAADNEGVGLAGV